jgi:transposase
MNCATKTRRTQIVVGLVWAAAFLAFVLLPQQPVQGQQMQLDIPVLAGAVLLDSNSSAPFPQWPCYRMRKWAWRRYCALRRAHRRAVCVARMAGLALTGALTLAQVVDWLTGAQFRRHVGALPVLYALLETLQVREVINRYCPTQADVDHGTVALVLTLNRLTMPLPLYQVADWMARTMLVQILAVPAAKFNDDRLARTLDALQPHCQAIWEEVAHRALVQAKVDLSVIFYDLTAYITHGTYTDSEYVDFGFANNTPMNKRKFKNGLDVSADGNMPTGYALWSGRTTDMATVEENMIRLKRFLQRHGYRLDRLLIVGDRANLSDKLALAYDEQQIRYLAGLRVLKKVHRALLLAVPTAQFYAHPLTEERGPSGYWGMPCLVPFEHEGRKVTHRGLVVLSGPMRTALRQTRAAQLWELRQALQKVQSKTGEPYHRTAKSLQRRANAKLNASPVGKFVRAEATADEQGQVHLRCWVDRYTLWQACERDGRYLLVTNDWSLSPRQMFTLYRQKDGVEKRIRVSKHDLKVSPLYLHKDERIEAMLLVSMLALLAYSLLERQVRRNGLQITTRQIIAKLQSLDLLVTCCWDGSQLYRLAPIDEEQAALLQVLADVLVDLSVPRCPYLVLSTEECPLLALPPPQKAGMVV